MTKKDSIAKRAQKAGISRQRQWQLDQIQAGNCARCGNPRNRYATRCDECQEKETAKRREKRGFKPWRAGGPGRKPKK